MFCLHVWLCSAACLVPEEAGRGIWIPQNWSYGYGQLCECWDEWPVLYCWAVSLQPQIIFILDLLTDVEDFSSFCKFSIGPRSAVWVLFQCKCCSTLWSTRWKMAPTPMVTSLSLGSSSGCTLFLLHVWVWFGPYDMLCWSLGDWVHTA